MGRRTRTLLPTSAKLLQPKYSTHNLKSSLEKIQAKQKHYYDHGTRTLEPLTSGEGVRLRDTSTGNWIPATVKRIADEPRSYIVESNGQEYRRNRRDLLKLPTKGSKGNDTTQQRVESEHSSQESHPRGSVTTRLGRTIKPPVKLGFS